MRERKHTLIFTHSLDISECRSNQSEGVIEDLLHLDQLSPTDLVYVVALVNLDLPLKLSQIEVFPGHLIVGKLK